MKQHWQRLLIDEEIKVEDIKYILSESPYTAIYIEYRDQPVKVRYRLKDIFEVLPQDDFLNVQKGVVIAKRYIEDITEDGIYKMKDGSEYTGRRRNMAEHKKNRKAFYRHMAIKKPVVEQDNSPKIDPLRAYELIENMPIAFCVIELIFDENGHGMDFIFRYCNKKMEELEGVPLEKMINHSFYEVFKNGDKKWLVAYADVALNGVQRVIEDYSPEVNKHLTIHCYQPKKNYCACALIPKYDE